MPVQIMAFVTVELAMAGVLYFFWLVVDHWSIAVAAVLVPWGHMKIRDQMPRGYISHFFWSLGFVKINGYPSPMSRKFEE